jgi:hypothetical protein
MNRQIRITSALALTSVLCASLPVTASAGGPLLSGYGGPGAGEQAIVGSTVLNTPRGGAGSGGASSGGAVGSQGPGGAGQEGAATSSSGSSAHGSSGGGQGSSGGSPSSPGSSSSRTAHTIPESRHARAGAAAPHRADYVYPTSAAAAESGTSAIGISSGDVLLLVGILASIGLVALITVRLARLQP